MNDLITFISKFQGIFGTLLGVTVTFTITQLSKRLGKLYFYFYDYNIDYYGENKYGEHDEIEDISKADYCDYKLRIQLYNSSETIKVLKDIKIEFVLKNKSIYSKPSNEDNVIKHTVYSEYKDFNFINIRPKELNEINIKGSIHDEDMIEVSKVKRIYFSAKNQRNKNIRKLIQKF